MAQPNYSLVNLLPDFSTILTGDFTSAAGLCAVIVLCILVVFACGLAAIGWLTGSSLRRVRTCRSLIDNLTPDSAPDKRRALLNQAQGLNHIARVWSEFDQNLVEIPGKTRLYNSATAQHFFNAHTVAPGVRSNRFLLGISGFLTAIGVIGTFAGLQMGLSHLSGDGGEQLSPDMLRQGIFGMIGGAAIAFMTSVWGLVTSLLFNVIEKAADQLVRRELTALQGQLNFIFPPASAFQSLAAIQLNSGKLNEAVLTLDEKIADKLQEAMQQSNTALESNMTAALLEALQPAIEKLTQTAESGATEAITHLLEHIQKSADSNFQQQNQALKSVADNLGSATQHLSTGINDSLTAFRSELEAQAQTAAAANAEINTAVIKTLESHTQDQAAARASVEEQLNSLIDKQSTLASTIQQLVAEQAASHEAITSATASILDGAKDAAAANQETVHAMQGAATDLKALSALVTSALDAVGPQIHSATESIKSCTTSNMELLTKFEHAADSLASSVTQYAEAASHADKGIEAIGQHFENLAGAMKTQVAELESQMTALLTAYATEAQEQTSDRLNAWNHQTNEFTSTLVDAVRCISEVVDQIESSVSASREVIRA